MNPVNIIHHTDTDATHINLVHLFDTDAGAAQMSPIHMFDVDTDDESLSTYLIPMLMMHI